MKRLLILLVLLQPALAQPGGDEYTVRKNLINVRKKLKISHKQLAEANKQEQELADELGITEGLVEEFSERLREVRTELALARSRHLILRQQVQESRERLKRKRMNVFVCIGFAQATRAGLPDSRNGTGRQRNLPARASPCQKLHSVHDQW